MSLILFGLVVLMIGTISALSGFLMTFTSPYADELLPDILILMGIAFALCGTGAFLWGCLDFLLALPF